MMAAGCTSQNDERGKGALMGRGRTVLVTGSCGLIGSEVTPLVRPTGILHYGNRQQSSRRLLRTEGDTSWVLGHVCSREIPDYRHEAIDIRDRDSGPGPDGGAAARRHHPHRRPAVA